MVEHRDDRIVTVVFHIIGFLIIVIEGVLCTQLCDIRDKWTFEDFIIFFLLCGKLHCNIDLHFTCMYACTHIQHTVVRSEHTYKVLVATGFNY